MSCTILYIQKNTYQHKCPLDASVLFFFVCSPFEFATLELLKAVASCEELQQCFRMLLKSSSPSPEITVPWEWMEGWMVEGWRNHPLTFRENTANIIKNIIKVMNPFSGVGEMKWWNCSLPWNDVAWAIPFSWCWYNNTRLCPISQVYQLDKVLSKAPREGSWELCDVPVEFDALQMLCRLWAGFRFFLVMLPDRIMLG